MQRAKPMDIRKVGSLDINVTLHFISLMISSARFDPRISTYLFRTKNSGVRHQAWGTTTKKSSDIQKTGQNIKYKDPIRLCFSQLLPPRLALASLPRPLHERPVDAYGLQINKQLVLPSTSMQVKWTGTYSFTVEGQIVFQFVKIERKF